MTDSTQPLVLITGGTGFAGSHLVETLLSQGQTNLHVTTASDKPSFVSDLLPSSSIHQLDLADQEETFALITELQPAQIYHLAALAEVGSSFDKTQEIIQENTQLQLNLLEAVRQCCPQTKILVVGSGMEYDLIQNPSLHADPTHQINEQDPLGPVSPYAVSKVLQDLLALSYHYSYDLKVLRVRPFNHIGERQSPNFVVASFAQQIIKIERGEQSKIHVGNLEAVRDFTDVKDIVRAYILVMEKGEVGEVYNIGSGTGQSIERILQLLCEQAQVKIQVEVDQARIRPLDIPVAIANNRKITALGWSPQIPIETTLARIVNYWRSL